MLVNSAGMSIPGRFLDLKPEDFKVGSVSLFLPRHERTGLPGFRTGPTQTRLYNHRR